MLDLEGEATVTVNANDASAVIEKVTVHFSVPTHITLTDEEPPLLTHVNV